MYEKDLFGDPVEPKKALPKRPTSSTKSSSKINPNQLAFLMQAKDIMATHEPISGDYDEIYDEDIDDHRTETTEELWDRKLNESHDRGLYDSIAEHGVHAPISLEYSNRRGTKPQIMGGHHRLASAMDIDPEMWIPVTYNDAPYQAWHEEDQAAEVSKVARVYNRGGWEYDNTHENTWNNTKNNEYNNTYDNTKNNTWNNTHNNMYNNTKNNSGNQTSPAERLLRAIQPYMNKSPKN